MGEGQRDREEGGEGEAEKEIACFYIINFKYKNLLQMSTDWTF